MAAIKPDYLSRDYDGLKSSLLQYAAQVFPEWQPASEGDLGMVLLELFAYQGDILSYYTDRAQFENYISTATQRDSVLAQAYLLGYVPNSGSPASGTVRLVTSEGVPDTLVLTGTQISTNMVTSVDGPVVFETTEDIWVPGDGATSDEDPGGLPGITVNVTEGISEVFTKIGESTGYPSQMMNLSNTGVYRDTIHIFVEDNLGSTVFNDGVSNIRVREWTMADHLLDGEDTSPIFETQIQDTTTQILFGDDINGAIPATGLKVYASYRYGYGSTGNVAAGEVFLVNDQTVTGVTVGADALGNFYSSAMTGGADPETTDSIRKNAPRAYKIQDRIITESDFINAALNVDGVSKANAQAGTFTSVTVYITGTDGGIPSQAIKDEVTRRLQTRTLFGVDVTVAPPVLVPVNYGSSGSPVLIEVEERYSQAGVRASVLREAGAYMAGITFGERLSVGGVYSVLSGIEGVKTVTIPIMARSDATQSGTATMTPRPWEVFTLGTLNLSLTGGIA